MGKLNAMVVGFLLHSGLFVGCSGSMVIDPAGRDREKLYSREIEYVIARDSTIYTFEGPPSVVGDSIVGLATIWSTMPLRSDTVSIPLAAVAEVSVKKQMRPWVTMAVLVMSALIVYAFATMYGLLGGP